MPRCIIWTSTRTIIRGRERKILLVLANTVPMGFPVVLIPSAFIVVIVIPSSVLAIHHYGHRHHGYHHPHHKCTRHHHFEWHPGSTVPIWNHQHVSVADFDREEYLPVNVEYQVPIVDNGEQIIKPLEPAILVDPNAVISSSSFIPDDNHPANIFKIKKIKKKRKKKIHKPIPKILEPETTTPPVNRFILIEGSNAKFDPEDEQNLKHQRHQIIKSIMDAKSQSDLIQQSNQPQNQDPLQPILTIKDLHEQLNKTLLVKLIGGKKNESDPNMLHASSPTSLSNMTTFETANNISTSSKSHNNQDFFIKANKFSFQNGWSYVTSTESSSFLNESSPKLNESKTPVEQLVPSGTTNRHWIPTPSPPLVLFTSQRTVTQPSPIFNSRLKSSSTTLRRTNHPKPAEITEENLKFSAIKRGDKITEPSLDIGKLGSIIFAFCVSMMLLAGIILMVLHKDTVTEQFQNLANRMDHRFPPAQGSEQEQNRNGSDADQQPQTSSSTSGQPNPGTTNTPRAATVGPSGSPPRMNQDLIEQIIGRPENSFSTKKSRQYFSRVHRWVPKRPPLPSDLVDQSQHPQQQQPVTSKNQN